MFCNLLLQKDTSLQHTLADIPLADLFYGSVWEKLRRRTSAFELVERIVAVMIPETDGPDVAARRQKVTDVYRALLDRLSVKEVCVRVGKFLSFPALPL